MASVTTTKGHLTVRAHVGDAKTLLAFDLDKSATKSLAGFTIQTAPPGVTPYYIFNELQFKTPADHAQDATLPPNSSINAPIHKFRWLHVPGSAHQGLKPVYGKYKYTVMPRYFDSKSSLMPLDPALGAVIAVDLYGQCADLAPIRRLCEDPASDGEDPVILTRALLSLTLRSIWPVATSDPTERELRATRTDTATLLRDSDFVSIHTPLLPDTRHLINAQSLRTMKKTAYLVNASRGPVVDEAALVQALKEGWIAGAGLDVFEEEPKVHPGLMGLSNVVLAPHIASASSDTRIKMAALAVDNCLAVLEGQTPPTPVNPEVLGKR